MNMLTLKIDPIQSKLAKMGISYNAYQKLLAIAEDVIHQQGYTPSNITPFVEPELTIAEVVFDFDKISVEQAVTLNSHIDEAVLQAGLEDEQFAYEIRHLVTCCMPEREVA